MLLLHLHDWRSCIPKRRSLFLTALCSDLFYNQKWSWVPLLDQRLLVLKCRGLWCIAECHLSREKFSSPLPLYLYLVSMSYCIFSWPRSWLPEKRVMGIRENSSLASPCNLEGGYFKLWSHLTPSDPLPSEVTTAVTCVTVGPNSPSWDRGLYTTDTADTGHGQLMPWRLL